MDGTSGDHLGTGGDGAKHDVIPDKGALATATTCNVFRLLKACGLPVAFGGLCVAATATLSALAVSAAGYSTGFSFDRAAAAPEAAG